MPPSRCVCFVSSSRRCRSTRSWRDGAHLSRRARRRGDVFVMDFCFPLLFASRRRSLRRRWGERERCAGAVAVALLCLAAGWRMLQPMLGWWSAGGGSGSVPRRRRPDRPDLEKEGELGDVPRPACHSEMWAPRCFFRRFTKPLMAMELPPSRASWISWLPLSVLVAGDERRAGAVRAELFKDLVVISLFFGDLFALCMGLCVLLDLSCCVRVLYSVFP